MGLIGWTWSNAPNVSNIIKPRLEFKDVAFSYQEKLAILSRVSFYVDPGEKVAIIGQNGSGKSTILNLLLRLYTPDSGAITADGVSIFQFPLDEYSSLFSVVSQEPYLFIGENCFTKRYRKRCEGKWSR